MSVPHAAHPARKSAPDMAHTPAFAVSESHRTDHRPCLSTRIRYACRTCMYRNFTPLGGGMS
eukprot:3939035-Rhodomonas_salina.3